MKSIFLSTLAVLCLTAPQLALAKNANDTRVCDKIETCLMAEMRAQGLPASMLQMTKSSIKSMCQQREDGLALYQKPPTKALQNLADQCISSIEKLSCKTLMSKTQVDTPACAKYRKASAAYVKK